MMMSNQSLPIKPFSPETGGHIEGNQKFVPDSSASPTLSAFSPFNFKASDNRDAELVSNPSGYNPSNGGRIELSGQKVLFQESPLVIKLRELGCANYEEHFRRSGIVKPADLSMLTFQQIVELVPKAPVLQRKLLALRSNKTRRYSKPANGSRLRARKDKKGSITAKTKQPRPFFSRREELEMILSNAYAPLYDELRQLLGYFDAKTFASESIAEKLAEDFEKSFSAAARTQRLDVNSFENKNPLPLSQISLFLCQLPGACLLERRTAALTLVSRLSPLDAAKLIAAAPLAQTSESDKDDKGTLKDQKGKETTVQLVEEQELSSTENGAHNVKARKKRVKTAVSFGVINPSSDKEDIKGRRTTESRMKTVIVTPESACSYAFWEAVLPQDPIVENESESRNLQAFFEALLWAQSTPDMAIKATLEIRRSQREVDVLLDFLSRHSNQGSTKKKNWTKFRAFDRLRGRRRSSHTSDVLGNSNFAPSSISAVSGRSVSLERSQERSTSRARSMERAAAREAAASADEAKARGLKIKRDSLKPSLRESKNEDKGLRRDSQFNTSFQNLLGVLKGHVDTNKDEEEKKNNKLNTPAPLPRSSMVEQKLQRGFKDARQRATRLTTNFVASSVCVGMSFAARARSTIAVSEAAVRKAERQILGEVAVLQNPSTDTVHHGNKTLLIQAVTTAVLSLCHPLHVDNLTGNERISRLEASVSRIIMFAIERAKISILEGRAAEEAATKALEKLSEKVDSKFQNSLAANPRFRNDLTGGIITAWTTGKMEVFGMDDDPTKYHKLMHQFSKKYPSSPNIRFSTHQFNGIDSSFFTAELVKSLMSGTVGIHEKRLLNKMIMGMGSGEKAKLQVEPSHPKYIESLQEPESPTSPTTAMSNEVLGRLSGSYAKQSDPLKEFEDIYVAQRGEEKKRLESSAHAKLEAKRKSRKSGMMRSTSSVTEAVELARRHKLGLESAEVLIEQLSDSASTVLVVLPIGPPPDPSKSTSDMKGRLDLSEKHDQEPVKSSIIPGTRVELRLDYFGRPIGDITPVQLKVQPRSSKMSDFLWGNAKRISSSSSTAEDRTPAQSATESTYTTLHNEENGSNLHAMESHLDSVCVPVAEIDQSSRKEAHRILTFTVPFDSFAGSVLRVHVPARHQISKRPSQDRNADILEGDAISSNSGLTMKQSSTVQTSSIRFSLNLKQSKSRIPDPPTHLRNELTTAEVVKPIGATTLEGSHALHRSLTADALYHLGMLLRNGRGVKYDPRRAASTWIASGVLAHGHAQNNLGLLLSTGEGLAKNETTAVAFYALAAERGIESAMFNLGNMLAAGRGVAKNEFAAVVHWLSSAATGHAQAHFNCGVMFEKGLGVPGRDPVRAVAHYTAAADLGSTAACFNLGWLYENGAGNDDRAQELYGSGAGVPRSPLKEEGQSLWKRSLVTNNFGGERSHDLHISYLAPSKGRALHYYMRATSLGDVKAAEAVERLIASERMDKKREATREAAFSFLEKSDKKIG